MALLISSPPRLCLDQDSIPTFCPSDQPGNTLLQETREPVKFTEQNRQHDGHGALGGKSRQPRRLGAGDGRAQPQSCSSGESSTISYECFSGSCSRKQAEISSSPVKCPASLKAQDNFPLKNWWDKALAGSCPINVTLYYHVTTPSHKCMPTVCWLLPQEHLKRPT